MSETGTELNLKLLGAEVGELPETAAGGHSESIDNERSKVTLGLGSGEDQDRSGSLTSLEQELLTLGAQPQDAPQMLSSDLAGSSVEQAIAAEEAALGESVQAGQTAGGGSAEGQGPGNIGGPVYPPAAIQPQEYGGDQYNHYGGQVKLEDDGRRSGQGRPADGSAPGEVGAGAKRPLEGAHPGLGLSRQSTEESLGRHLEGGREGEDGGTEGEEQEGRGQGNKKQRLVWTAELHSRFMNAVNHLGVKNAVPKTILQLMNVEGMTRENVASHLQKYRLYLKRLAGLPPNARLSPELVQGGSHLYPYVHPPHEVPPPMMMPPPPLHQGYAPHAAPYYPPPHRSDPGAPPLMGSPAAASGDASAPGPKPGEGRGGEAGASTYPAGLGSIPPSPPHFGYTPEMYSGFSSMAHAGWHPLPGPGPGQPQPTQFRATDALPGSPALPGQGAQYSSPGAGHYGGPVGGSMYGAGAGVVAGVGSPAPLQGSPYGYQGAAGAHYGGAAMGSPGGTGSPPSVQRGSAPAMQQYPAPTWQQDPPGGGFSQHFWMQPAAQDWQQKRWPDAGPPQQRKW